MALLNPCLVAAVAAAPAVAAAAAPAALAAAAVVVAMAAVAVPAVPAAAVVGGCHLLVWPPLGALHPPVMAARDMKAVALISTGVV